MSKMPVPLQNSVRYFARPLLILCVLCGSLLPERTPYAVGQKTFDFSRRSVYSFDVSARRRQLVGCPFFNEGKGCFRRKVAEVLLGFCRRRWVSLP
jgi:hypothetical protein